MKRILVPTDFSPNSKSGVKFAIQWAAQQDVELVFIHVLNLMIPTRWSQVTVAKYIAGELEVCRKRFRKYIDNIYDRMKVKPGLYSTVLIQEYDPAKTILEYCRKEKNLDFICISTNGAGPVTRLLGTNTSELIAKSPIPVLAIPRIYKPRQVKTILYATDFRHYREELEKVLAFAAPFGARVDVIHFTSQGEIRFNEEDLEKLSGEYAHGLNVILEEDRSSLSLPERLQRSIQRRKPSLVIMFSNKERSLMQKIFSSSNTKELSFDLKAPLLVFSKMETLTKKKEHELA